jgi:hypothetical protein
VYLPDIRHPAYPELRDALEAEFTYVFGGCSLVSGLQGSYLARNGSIIRDRVNLLFVDAPFAFGANSATLSTYLDRVRQAVISALNEEEILIVAYPVYHCTDNGQ